MEDLMRIRNSPFSAFVRPVRDERTAFEEYVTATPKVRQHFTNVEQMKSNPVMRNMQEIVPGLYLGSCLAHDFETLVNTGITHIVCVRTKEEEEYLTHSFPDWFRYKMIELDDSISSNVIPIIPQVKEFIDDCLRINGKVLVQSYFGTSRSAILVIGYIMETYKLTLGDAIKVVQDKRTCVDPNEYFLNQLKDYEAIYKARKWYNSGHSSKQMGNSKRCYEDMEGPMLIDGMDTVEPHKKFALSEM